jgi:LacI family transcriptional regulator
MVKMVDVAEHAGVSVKTVSRVLNNEAHVQDKVRKRVFESVETLGYVPSASARNLRSRRTYGLHFITHSTRSNFLNAIQSGALMASQKRGYSLFWNYLDPNITKDPAKLKNWCDRLIKDSRPDGIILTPPYTNYETVNACLNAHKVPIVRIGPNKIMDDNITVKIDDRLAARDATQHLIDLGHERIAFIRGVENQHATHERYKGYCDALERAGISNDDSLVFPGTFNFASGMTAGEKIVNMENRPTAVFAANDDMAAGVIVAAHKNNIKIPEEISIIGFDDSEMAERIWPALTTIRQPRVEYGERSTEILISMAGSTGRGRAASKATELMDYDLILRDSTSAIKK